MLWLSVVSCLLTLFGASKAQLRAHNRNYDKVPTCEFGSCYPGTGNLLIGRENRLFASSTCGIRGQEKYCIVSHLEKQRNQQCFWCDAQYSSMSHNVSNIVDIMDPHSRVVDPWWQSENGVEKVYIQLNMEAEFHFTHLIINFKTFRPAAMIIERSNDFGKTWKVYRYFAANCESTFKNISTGTPRKLNDVVCDNRYSHVNPSSGGELIFRVISPNIHVEDPFSTEVQELVKMTNLRINFTRLHTLGDNLLDQRDEILEKYYYAINHMIVRGSCSCYGHASVCLPLPELAGRYYPPDMVHGQCLCTHNTKGPNCNECEDFYNDLRWKAAYGKSQNACKRCNCNNHATACEFDENIFKASGEISGGVCKNCLHNTEGINCERCKPYFFHDPQEDMQSPHACRACGCNTLGTVDDGECDRFTDEGMNMVSGACHCKENVGGRTCDQCKEGFWKFNPNNPLGCEPCQCNIDGTEDNKGCNMDTGECTCKRFVVGRDCNQCLPQFWGLSSQEKYGCKPCDCDPGGAYDNFCDVISGQCKCRPHITGRACDKPENSYFTPLPDYNVYEAEAAQATPEIKIQIIEPNQDRREVTWSGTGYMRVFEGSELEFLVDNIPSAINYDVVIRYAPQHTNGWDNVTVQIIPLGASDSRGPCANTYIPRMHTSLPPTARSIVLPQSVCLEPGMTYKVVLTFDKYDQNQNEVSASVLIDSIVLYPSIVALPIMPPEDLRQFDHFRCAENFLQPNHGELYPVCIKYLKSIGSFVNQGAFQCDCNTTGSTSHECAPLGGNCDCKINVKGRKCDMCQPGTHSFGPEGCKACDCDSLALDNICDPESGQCKCGYNHYGLKCNKCQEGFWNFPNCQRCECNGHAANCDPTTGICNNCLNFTEGVHCDKCIKGFYGEPRIGYNIPCRPCQCPGTIDSGHSYAESCSLDHYTKNLYCQCSEGYTGAYCDQCADNYYGSPDLPGEVCLPCDCNGNVDMSQPGNCDRKTGKCLKCLYNTEGDHCEICKERYHGDALKHDCQPCFCELLGTNLTQEYCNRSTGQCPCLPKVIGLACDQCLENHWKIASGVGCEPCNCHRNNSYSEQCNPFTGQCDCKDGFGSTRCDECEEYHWGANPSVQCNRCDCDRSGSVTMQCDRTTGACSCTYGVGGYRCDQCARGFLGYAPSCYSCGECFFSWDNILNKLRNDTANLLTFAANIKEVGVWGAYTAEFGDMEAAIKNVQLLLNRTDVSLEGIERIKNAMNFLDQKVGTTSDRVAGSIREIEDTDQKAKRTDRAMIDLREQMEELLSNAASLKENATKLQEANVEGALNLTRKARKDSQDAEERMSRILEAHVVNAERSCKRTFALHNRTGEDIGKNIAENENALVGLKSRVDDLVDIIPEINEKVCGKYGQCDFACGGAGCGMCGGLSCENGAVTKANMSLDLVNRADMIVKEKESKAEDLLRNVTQIKHDATMAKTLTEDAFAKSETARNKSSEATKKSYDFSEKLSRFMATPGAKPSEIRSLAEDTKKMNLNNPDEVKELSMKIHNAVRNLTNIKGIIHETNIKKDRAKVVKDEANLVKVEAENVLDKVQNVNAALIKAAEAQAQADKAIRLVNTDIATAEKHLTQILSESSEADLKSRENLACTASLKERWLDYNTKLTKYKINTEEIQKIVEGIKEEARRTVAATSEFKKNSKTALNLLELRAAQSESAKENAKKLSERASQFYVVTASKLSYLKDLEQLYKEKDARLQELKREMQSLSKQMEDHVRQINTQSKHYNDCNP